MVKWSTGDEINVFTDADEKLTLTLYKGENTSLASFVTGDNPTGNPTYAIYPASSNNTVSGNTISFTMPDTQKYTENSFANGVNVAVAVAYGKNLDFKNVFGVLKVTLKGTMKVRKIELTGNNDEYLWGEFTVDATTAAANGAEYSKDGGKTLTLDCSSFNASSDANDGGVYLSGEGVVFNFVVPVNAFGDSTKGGFKIKIYDAAGNSYYKEIGTTSSENIINRSKIRVMDPQIVSFLPVDYTAIENIQSTGAQYINMDRKLDICTNSLRFETSLVDSSLHGEQDIIGNQDESTNRFVIGLSEDKFFSYSKISSIKHTNCVVGYKSNCINDIVAIYDIVNEKKTLSVNGETSIVSAPGLAVNNINSYIRLFAGYNTQLNPYCFSRMYCGLMLLTVDNILWYYLIPAKNSEGVAGMYDVVGSTFYPSSTTTAFVAGPVIE